MKKVILLLTFFSLSLTTTFAQAGMQYYYADGEKISVQKNAESFIIHFKEATTFEAFAKKKKPQGISKIESFSSNQFAIIHQNENATKSLNEILSTLNLEQQEVIIHEGLQLDDGFTQYPMDEVVVQFNERGSHAVIKHLATAFNATLKERREDISIYKLNDINQVLNFANTIEETGFVKWATPDFYAPITKDNDPKYIEQFQLNNTGQTISGVAGLNDMDVNAPEAWTISTGSSNIIVAVMDDGVEDHEDLMDENGNSRVLSGSTPNGGGNGAPGTDGDHGQAVSGIIAASHNNIGVRGLAPKVKILPVNLLNGATTQQIADGYTFARQNGADVLSSSWSYQSCTANYSNINQAISDCATLGRNGKGSFMAFTAGNNGRGNCINYPARLNTVIAVGAVTQIGEHASYSNQGPNIDIVAPSRAASTQTGAGVRTIDRMGAEGYGAGNYTDNFGGTSAACPVISGVAALVLSVNPDLTKSELQNILLTTATDMGDNGFDNTYGNGRVNAYAAVLAAGSPIDPTCDDGVQNGDEEGVDCGGTDCPDCPVSYCNASGSNSNYEYIDNVTLSNINNTSGNNTGYGDFTSLSANLNSGNTYTINLTPGFQGTVYNEFWKVWIDYNSDGDFDDANELVLEATNGSNTVVGTFTVPAGAQNVGTRMRVSMKWDAYPTGPCETFNYGEIEDYGVAITNNSTTPTCDDGIQNGNETGVDCGGPDCAACPTCDDGIQNGNETGVDCGGPDCAACPTCDDGIQNGNETGVDCGGPDCAPCTTSDCDLITFTSSNVYGYGGSQDNGSVTVLNANAIKIENNAWKAIDFNYTITPNTMISFEFASTIPGEIAGIGFDVDLGLSSNRTFKLSGSQTWGISNYDNYTDLGFWKSYTIPVGDFYTGAFNHLFFVGDFDASPQNSNGYFRNIQVYENSGSCSNPDPLDGLPIDASNPTCSAEGQILLEKWNNIGGGVTVDLVPTTNPTTTENVNLFEMPVNTGDNYGVRMRGYICPPVSGNYTFWIASDDNGELWLSSDDNLSNKQLIANVPEWTSSREWTKYASQQSIEISLIAGQSYYVEAVVKEQSGGDNLAVGWTLPDGTLERPIAGTYLSPAGPQANSDFDQLALENTENNLRAYPNPTSDVLNLEMHGNQFLDADLYLFDINGKLIKQMMLKESNTQISLESLNQGMYIMHVIPKEGKKEIFKIVKT